MPVNAEQISNPLVKREVPVKRSIWLPVCCFIAVFLNGCATTRFEEYGPPPDVEALPDPPATAQAPKGRVAELESYITRLEAELSSRLSGLEMANSDISTQLLSLAEQLESIQNKLEVLKAKPATSNPGSKQKPLMEKAELSVDQMYDRSMQYYSTRNYERARDGFRKILEMDPKGDLADNAQYWLGECEYAKRDFSDALAAFQKVFLFPKTEKDDDAQLKLGLCYLQTGDRESAMIEFKRLVVDYPESEYVSRAEELLNGIREQSGSAGP